ncbi:MAG: 50S ribosomal protein L17 [Caldimicrobium sp.]
MRHRKLSRRLTSTTEHRIALLRNQVRDLLKHGRITTTLAKAKELRRYADRMITLAKKGDLAARRRALAFIQDKDVVRKLFSELREKYLDRPGGYTRIIKLGQRRGDGSHIAIIELVEEKLSFKKSKKLSERLKKVQEFIEKKKKEGRQEVKATEEITKESPKDTEASSKEAETQSETQ